MKVKCERDVAQSCPTLSDPMDCSSVYGIFQARVPEWGGEKAHTQVGVVFLNNLFR